MSWTRPHTCSNGDIGKCNTNLPWHGETREQRVNHTRQLFPQCESYNVSNVWWLQQNFAKLTSGATDCLVKVQPQQLVRRPRERVLVDGKVQPEANTQPHSLSTTEHHAAPVVAASRAGGRPDQQEQCMPVCVCTSRALKSAHVHMCSARCISLPSDPPEPHAERHTSSQ